MERIDLAKLHKCCAIGAELGVAKGEFSEALYKTRRYRQLWSIDAWAGDRGHNEEEYQSVLKRFQPHENLMAYRKTFEEAALDFKDETFDFIYIDGYAHKASDTYKVLDLWWPKLRKNGVFAGHDYCDCWGPVKKVVNAFSKIVKRDVQVTIEPCEMPLQHPSWYIQK